MHIFSVAVLDVLTNWHQKRGKVDEEYMWNVTLPGYLIQCDDYHDTFFLELLLDVYKQVFQIGSLEEAESSIFNTNINEE